ncbi:PREDICTED: JNK1/MAPK8-associated membrane protein-like [Acropora digitifera]|uniref:JNK1/MAPK8-associated membrane protein-like n=1 Tax=Acropora digitifera TaxID=70779 RepID=UPI00077B05A6|nr:PREDICTED: JNK1/MAPK8-associated membrane protein-like [Acropora digitifera]
MSLLSKEPLIVVWILLMFQKGSNGALDPCSGKYCGRIINNNGHFGDCGACPRGYRTNGSVCLECLSSPELYDWLYLGFMASLPVIIHWFFIDFFIKRERKRYVREYNCNRSITYGFFFVFFSFTRYTIVLMYYAVCVGLLILVRPIISHQFCDGQGRASIYAALYFLPSLVVLHAVFGGLIYYGYPYATLVLSVLSTAAVLAKNNITHIRQLLSRRRHVIIILAHWLVHAYGILAVTLLRNPAVHGPLFSLVLSPVLFYLVTHSFTEPNKFKT